MGSERDYPLPVLLACRKLKVKLEELRGWMTYTWTIGKMRVELQLENERRSVVLSQRELAEARRLHHA